jgi:hypothetical protein
MDTVRIKQKLLNNLNEDLRTFRRFFFCDEWNWFKMAVPWRYGLFAGGSGNIFVEVFTLLYLWIAILDWHILIATFETRTCVVCVINLIANFHMMCRCLGQTAPPMHSFYLLSVNIGCIINTAVWLTRRQNCNFQRDNRRKNRLHIIFCVAVVCICTVRYKSISLLIFVYVHSFHWRVQNTSIPCLSQELLPFLSVM